MTDNRYLEAGKIVNTHGIRGEVKIVPWADSAEFLLRFKTLYLDGNAVRVVSSRVHKGNVIAALEGVTTVESAQALKDKTVFIDRDDVHLNEGEYFISDVLGLDAVDDKTGKKIGIITDFYEYPASIVYVIKGDREILLPAVPEFLKKVDVAGGTVRVKLIEGM